MNPSDEAPVWQEIKRLREQLDYANERHAAALENIRTRISELEKKLSSQTTTNVVEPSASPPPLPEEALPAPRPKPVIPARMAKAPAPVKIETVSIPEPVPEAKEDSSFELDFGKVWFVRIGVVILLTGLVFLGNFAYQNWIREMSNGTRLAALFACAIGLVETGRRLAAKENLNRFGEVLLAGGMAFFYYCTFAAHHVGRLKVIDSPVIGALLIFAAAGAITAVSWLRKNQGTAILGIVLASYSTMLQPIGWMSCISSILLGAMGLFFMLRPGWSWPGWASMLGSYGAFFGWQILGASGETLRVEDPATLWFLPPLWIMFAIPGVLGHFRESLSDRARAWFTGANNALFFLLFSGVWIARNGDGDYWKVAAIFGTALIALGILGRRQSTTAGGVNIAQGLAVATFALILKLDGHHLALVLAFESLTLAMAAWKYRGKSEAVFSLLAALGSGLFIADSAVAMPAVKAIPVWSGFLAAALIAAASFVTSRIKIVGEIFTPFLRISSGLLFVSSALIASYLCLFRLGEVSALATALFLTASLASVALRLDPARLWPELMWGALWFLGVASWVGFEGEKALPLTLAIECLALALVAWRFRSRSETLFSFGAGVVSAVLAMESGAAIPIWGTSMVAALVAAASGLTIRIKLAEPVFVRFTRVSAAFLFIAATFVASQLCLIRLESTASLLTAIGLSAILSHASLIFDRKRRQPEIAWGALWFLGVSCYRSVHSAESWPLAIATAITLAACWMWHRQPEPESTAPSIDLAKVPSIPAWAFSLAAPFLLWRISVATGEGYPHVFLTNHLAGLALLSVAILLRCKRLVAASAAFSFLSLGFILVPDAIGAEMLFAAAAIAIASAVILHTPWAKTRITDDFTHPSSVVFRATAFIAYCAAWHRFAPGTWSDWLALTSIILTLATLFLKQKILPESVALVSVSVVAFAIATLTSPWHLSPEESGWRGITVVIALLSLVLTYRQRPVPIENPETRARAIAGIAGLTCAVTTIWATQMLVWRFGWKPTAVLWTVLGFAFVSAGLWQRLHILRVCGFSLLVVSFIKLFTHDVWDFSAFMRVASFIVLGAALILLGLFYNKFAVAIKALLDDERSG